LKVAIFMMAPLSVLASQRGMPPGRWPGLVAAVVLVLALHGLLLFMLGPSWSEPAEPRALAPTLNVRSVVWPAAAPAVVESAPPPQQHQQLLSTKTARSRPLRGPQRMAPPTSAEAAATAPLPDPAAPPALPAQIAAAEPPPAAAIEVPVYSTRLPPSGSWRYRLQRGMASGEALLSWRPDTQGRYVMQLEGAVAGITVLDWVSTGALDGAGIAPERFVIRRRGKDSQAANFQRDAGKITFSGPTHEVPLLPGVQDRLSWMLQLSAVIEAAPQRFGAGANVVLMVIGARGGADVWTFKVIGPERVDDTPALRLMREARKPYDLQVDVWLDPARGHLPLRAVLAQPEGGTPLELQLLAGSTGS
jgi:hypothetical protein